MSPHVEELELLQVWNIPAGQHVTVLVAPVRYQFSIALLCAEVRQPAVEELPLSGLSDPFLPWS